jgi:pimeloyl-ACP methyl ester carboxylesterase
MAMVSVFRSDDARAAYFGLYDAALAASSMPVAETNVETSFGRTHVLTAGDSSKPPLVAIHPLAMSSTFWLPLLPTFAANHSVTLIDALGDLNKSVARKPITRANHVVSWLDESLTALGIERAAMVAMSMGTWMATQYAMTFPDRVERLALIAPVGLVSGQHLGWMLSAYYATYLRPTDARLETFIGATATPAGRHRLCQDPWRPIIQQFVTGTIGFKKPILTVRPTRCDLQRLASAQFPVLVIVGREESLHDGPRMADRLRRRLPHARVELLDEANHLIPIDQPVVVENLLTDFLSA